MSIHQYINQKQEFYKFFTDFIESDDDESILFQEDFQIQDNREELLFLLKLISKIANNHKCSLKFFQKNQRILLHYKNAILHLLSNYEIANIFKKNKRILLFLLEEKFIFIDKHVFRIVNLYPEYFSLEIEEFEGKNNNMTKNDQFLFEEKRKKGENDSYLCKLIQEYLVEDFISHVTKKNLNLNSYIKSSIFETNNLLLKTEPTIIQYSAFYGSIQIFQFLLHNEIELTSSIWPYVIHSKNPYLIHLIEENGIDPESYEQILIESIKCHHIEISEYFYNNFIDNPENNRNIQLACLKYYNFEYFPQEINNNFWFYYLCKHNYIKLVKLLLKAGNIDINRELTLTSDRNQTLLRISFDKNNNDIANILLNRKEIQITDGYFFGSGLIMIEIPKSITKICNNTFKYCRYLEKVTLPNTITSIGSNSFDGCSLLTSIEIPSSVTSIGDYAFRECKSLEKVIIPSSLRKIGHQAFFGCISLNEVLFSCKNPNGNENLIEETDSDNSSDFSCELAIIPKNEEKVEIKKDKNSNVSLDIIGSCTFKECISLTKIELPSSITMIGEDSFLSCLNLEHILLPPKLTKICMNTFVMCKSLTEIKLPLNVIEIERNAFKGCKQLRSIEMPDSISVIGEGAFYDCSSLKQITIPSSVKEIKSYTFYECSSLETINIPPYLSSVGEYAFNGCYSLKKISFPDSLTSIEAFSFFQCSSLEEIILPKSVTCIKKCAFAYCASLKKISIPITVKVIEDSAFHQLVSLEKLEIITNTISIGKFAFAECSSLKEILIIAEELEIGSNAFYKCYSLIKLTIPAAQQIDNLGIRNNVQVVYK